MAITAPAGARQRSFGIRRLSACALLAVTVAGSFATHHHSLLTADDESGGRGEERVVTRHNPLSRASHWHAVLAFVHEDECVACHNQRLAGLPVQSHDPAAVSSATTAVALPPARVLVAFLPPSKSRAPPDLP
jgi:hypothetical protein